MTGTVLRTVRYWVPDETYDTPVEALENVPRGAEGVVVDLDGVLMEVDGNHSPPSIGDNVDREVLDVFRDVASEYGACIVTNRVRYDTFDAGGLEDFFDVPVITDGLKPGAAVYAAALEELGGADPEKTVMIGDSPYFDTYGANRAGLTTFQVPQERGRYSFPINVTKRMEDSFQYVITVLDGV